jgi:hypothetical protein
MKITNFGHTFSWSRNGTSRFMNIPPPQRERERERGGGII